MIIRDDGSSDLTVNILRTLINKDDRIKLIVDDKGNQGPLLNYNLLCAEAVKCESDIIFFSDQDDVWLPDKLETQVQAIRNIEHVHSKDLPVLVYTDLSVVDKQLRRIHKSFQSFQGMRNISYMPLRVLLAQNYIPACATAINRSLLRLAWPIPENALMHDWWVALCAAACGIIEFNPQPMGFYRQHEDNKIGAKGLLGAINPFQKNVKQRWQTGRDNFLRSIDQAQQLKKRIEECVALRIQPGILSRINAYAQCLNQGRHQRIKSIREHGIRRQGWVYNILFYALLLFHSRKAF